MCSTPCQLHEPTIKSLNNISTVNSNKTTITEYIIPKRKQIWELTTTPPPLLALKGRKGAIVDKACKSYPG